MTTAGQSHPIPAIPPLPEGAGPRAIRAALIAEEREEFDQAYRRMLRRAAHLLSGEDVPEDEPPLPQLKERLARLGV